MIAHFCTSPLFSLKFSFRRFQAGNGPVQCCFCTVQIDFLAFRRALLERLPEAAGAMISGELDSPELLAAEEQGYLVLRKPVDPAALQLVLSHWLSAD